jgi:hypothetical protein
MKITNTTIGDAGSLWAKVYRALKYWQPIIQ